MSNFSSLILGNAALLAIGMSASAVASLNIFAPALAQSNFPDVEPNYWAQPFIERLAAQNIISGYPDGTFRPEQPLDRDEFAALIRDAFNQNEVHQVAVYLKMFPMAIGQLLPLRKRMKQDL